MPVQINHHSCDSLSSRFTSCMEAFCYMLSACRTMTRKSISPVRSEKRCFGRMRSKIWGSTPATQKSCLSQCWLYKLRKNLYIVGLCPQMRSTLRWRWKENCSSRFRFTSWGGNGSSREYGSRILLCLSERTITCRDRDKRKYL